MAICLRYVPDRDDVEDVMQDSFVKIYASLDGFDYRGEGSLKSYISRIVANEALDFVRRSSRYVFTDSIPEVAEDTDTDIDDIPNDVLLGMIGQLPTGYRLVLNMYVFENKSHNEIAEQFGIAAGTSASQYHRAKKMLARMINEYKKRQ